MSCRPFLNRMHIAEESRKYVSLTRTESDIQSVNHETPNKERVAALQQQNEIGQRSRVAAAGHGPGFAMERTPVLPTPAS